MITLTILTLIHGKNSAWYWVKRGRLCNESKKQTNEQTNNKSKQTNKTKKTKQKQKQRQGKNLLES